MKVRTRKVLREYWEKYPDAQDQLWTWMRDFEKANYGNFHEVKAHYGSADLIGDKIVFNIKGNKYRLIIKINFRHQAIRAIGFLTHAEYDKLDIKEL